jgi:hypothetical protein
MTSTRQRLAGAVRLADHELIDEAQEALAEVEARKARIVPSQNSLHTFAAISAVLGLPDASRVC